MKIKVYTRTICPRCLVIKREFTEAGVSYEEINIDKDENKSIREDLTSRGYLAAPILEVDGNIMSDYGEIHQFAIGLQEQSELLEQ